MRATFAVPLAAMWSLAGPRTRQHLWDKSAHARNWIILIGVGGALGAWAGRDVAARPAVH